MVKKFGGGKIFKVLVVCYNINDGSRTFEVVSPDLERFEDGVEFLVMNVVVEFGGIEFSEVECHQVYFACFELNGQDGGKDIVGSVGFDNDGSVRNPMGVPCLKK